MKPRPHLYAYYTMPLTAERNGVEWGFAPLLGRGVSLFYTTKTTQQCNCQTRSETSTCALVAKHNIPHPVTLGKRPNTSSCPSNTVHCCALAVRLQFNVTAEFASFCWQPMYKIENQFFFRWFSDQSFVNSCNTMCSPRLSVHSSTVWLLVKLMTVLIICT